MQFEAVGVGTKETNEEQWEKPLVTVSLSQNHVNTLDRWRASWRVLRQLTIQRPKHVISHRTYPYDMF